MHDSTVKYREYYLGIAVDLRACTLLYTVRTSLSLSLSLSLSVSLRTHLSVVPYLPVPGHGVLLALPHVGDDAAEEFMEGRESANEKTETNGVLPEHEVRLPHQLLQGEQLAEAFGARGARGVREGFTG